MKPGIPWSIKGVEPELREVAKTAARRSGMTLGEWLNSAINEQADSDPAAGASETPATYSPRSSLISTHPIERAATKLEDIAAQLSRLATRESEGAYRQPAPSVDDQVAMAKVLARVESSEKQTVEAFSAVNERLATISRQVNRSAQIPTVSKVEDAPSFQAMEKAVRNIVEHLEVSDRLTRDNMKTLQDRMSEMSSRVANSTSEQILRQAPAFNQLESRLSELAERMEQVPDQSQSEQLTEQLRAELQQLAGRIDEVRESSEALAARAQTQAVQTAQTELRTIEGRILGLLNEAKQSISSQQVGPAELQRFRQEIDRLNARIDEAPQPAAAHDVSALRVAVEQLSTRVAQGQDPRPMAELDRRVLEIARKVEQAEAATRNIPQLTDLEQRFAELDYRLQQSLINPTAQDPLQLTQKIAEVDERLARTEHQLGHLETIERAITQLYDAIEQNRKNAHEVAQDAAARMADQLSGQMGSGTMPELSSAPEIMALQFGLNAVREASESADHRNQETLEAVHETLEQIVAKLTELETAAIGQRLAQAVRSAHTSAPVPTPAPVFAAPEPDLSLDLEQAAEVPLNNPFAAAPEPVVDAPVPTPEAVFQPDPPPSNFMDPILAGTASPLGATDTPGNPFATASVDGVNASAPPSDNNINDWVTAARNLAQSSADAKKGSLTGFKPGADKKAKAPKKGISLPFLTRRTKKPAAIVVQPASTAAKPANNNQPQSKLRLVALGLLLLSLATFATTNYLGRIHGQVAPAPVTTDQPAATPDATPMAPQSNAMPAPAATPDAPKVASPQQQGDAGSAASTEEADPILTGALPAAKAPPSDTMPVQPAAAVSIDTAVGPAKLRQAAETGDANAQFIVATHYLNGDTVANDYAKAAYWYGRASAQGLAPAQYRLGTLYERGKGVEKNVNAALSWYERAGALGNVKAMHNVAVISAGTDAGKPDYAKAYKWFSLAAAHGLKDSEYNLAVLIERGLGTKQDTAEAYFWYLAAASQDDTDAQTRVDALSKTLSPDTVAAVKARFKAWTPDKASDVANVVAVNDTQWNPATPAQQSANTAPAAAAPSNINDQAKVLLDKLGYRVGAQDGTLDAKTSNAIKLFQIQQGMKVTGQASPDLVTLMQQKIG